MEQNKKGRGRPQKTIEALIWRGIIPETWKEDILNLGRQGKNKIHYANYLGITRNTLYKIMDRDKDFLHTIKLALEYSQEWWINKVRDSFEKENSGKVNSQLWKYMMENTFRQDWKPAEQQIDITSGGDKLNPDNKIIVDIVLPKKEDDTDTNG